MVIVGILAESLGSNSIVKNTETNYNIVKTRKVDTRTTLSFVFLLSFCELAVKQPSGKVDYDFDPGKSSPRLAQSDDQGLHMLKLRVSLT